MIYFHWIRGTDDGNHYGLIHGWNRNDQQFARFRPDLHDPQSRRAKYLEHLRSSRRSDFMEDILIEAVNTSVLFEAINPQVSCFCLKYNFLKNTSLIWEKWQVPEAVNGCMPLGLERQRKLRSLSLSIDSIRRRLNFQRQSFPNGRLGEFVFFF